MPLSQLKSLMSISTYVKPFEDGTLFTDGGRSIVLGKAKTGTFCHTATFIWVYQATREGELPAAETVVQHAQAFANALVLRGNRKRVTAKNAPLESDVLIFTDVGETQADHSCVAIRGGGDGLIGGYNQQDWFAGERPILNNDFSAYPVKSIAWAPRAAIFTRRRAVVNERQRYIWAVREAAALALMREFTQR